MSKYIKLEDALNVCRLKPIIQNGTTTGVSYPTAKEIVRELSDLPAIEVSEDCISREWVRENMLKYGFLAPDMTVSEFVADAPSVVPTTEQSSMVGEWLLDGRCSNCLQAPLTTHKTYCPNCGAKMKG